MFFIIFKPKSSLKKGPFTANNKGAYLRILII
jgi:hypothetical protein